MSLIVRLREGAVESIEGEHPFDILYTLYCLGATPPVLPAIDVKKRLGNWHDWIAAEPVATGDDDDTPNGGSQN